MQQVNTSKSNRISLVISWFSLLSLFMLSLHASAQPNYARLYKQQYGYSPSCLACHSEGGGTPLNAYGKDFKDQGKNLAAFTKLATLDSDQDGISNNDESLAKSNPGDKRSTPAKKGDWLDLSSLIPKEVQALFPQATAWKPMDATLTEQDIQKAKAMGVTLSLEDENTIYIPVAERRPIGTAMIFPVQHAQQTFFLILRSDRQLNFSEIKILKTEHSPELPNDPLFLKWQGQAIDSLETSDADTLAGQISRAVKRAGVVITLRLKGA